MSHQAIARKWRPQTFADVFGQQHVTRTLQNALRLRKLHHAYLLTGARGVGKTTAARILSRALNCEQGPTPDPCNTCSNCRDMLAGTFPDLIEIDAASHNSVEDVREIVEKVRYTPQRGKYKVYIIDEVHMVSKAGFNALLKTLEEPPPHVIFILATTDPQQLLETVVSRCQRFDFKMIPVRTIYERLKSIAAGEGVQIPDGSLMTIAREGGGSMRDAQSLLDQVLSFTDGAVNDAEVAEILGLIDRTILLDVCQACLGADVDAAVRLVARASAFGYDTRTFAGQLLETLRNVVVMRWVKDPERLLDLPDDEVARLRTMAQGVEVAAVQQRFDILAAAIEQIARSEQPRLILEMAVVKMASVRPYAPLDQLTQRLIDLERRLIAGGAPPPARAAGRVAQSPGPGFERAVAPERSAPPSVAVPAVGVPPASGAPGEAPQGESASGPSAIDTVAESKGPSPPAVASALAPEAAPSPVAAASPLASAVLSDSAPERKEPPRPTAPAGGKSLLGALKGWSAGAGASGASAASSLPAPSPSAPVMAAPGIGLGSGAQGPAVSVVPSGSVAPSPPPPSTRGAAPETKGAGPPSAPPRAGTPEIKAVDRGRPPELPKVAPVKRPDPEASPLCDGPRWRRFVLSLRNRQGLGPVQAVLSRAGFLGGDEQRLRIGFAHEGTFRQAERVLQGPELQAALDAAFRGAVQLEAVLDVDGRAGPSLAEAMERLRAEKLIQLDGDARDDAAVHRVLALFPQSRLEAVQLPDDLDFDDVD